MIRALALALFLSACATGFEAHDGSLTPLRISVTVAPFQEVRAYCSPLLRDTDAMGCTTVRAFGSSNRDPAVYLGRVVIPAGYDCAIMVSPSQTLFLHEWARCFGGYTLGPGLTIQHEDEVK